MRNITLCSILFIIGLSPALAQSYTSADVVRIKHFNDVGKIILSQVLEEEQASTFHLKDYLRSQATTHRISVQSTTTTSNEIVHTRFSGNFEQLQSNDFELCEKHTTSLRPFFGLSAHSTEAFDGVIVDKVVQDSPASTLGLEPGDIIYTFNDIEIQTFCDLSMQVAQCTVGQNVSVTYIKSGQELDKSTMTIGGQVVINTKYVICEENDLTVTPLAISGPQLELHMQVYPNPTTDIAHIKYSSTLEDAVNVHILDQNGKVLSSEQFLVFTGSIHTTYNFDQFIAGTYLVLITQGNQVTQERVVTIK